MNSEVSRSSLQSQVDDRKRKPHQKVRDLARLLAPEMTEDQFKKLKTRMKSKEAAGEHVQGGRNTIGQMRRRDSKADLKEETQVRPVRQTHGQLEESLPEELGECMIEFFM
jgi:hypothetical protein